MQGGLHALFPDGVYVCRTVRCTCDRADRKKTDNDKKTPVWYMVLPIPVRQRRDLARTKAGSTGIGTPAAPVTDV